MTLHFGAGAPTRAISRELGISHSTVREYLARISAAGITWPLPAEVTDQELERRLFVNGGVRAGARRYVEPDWAAVARELKRPGVNLMILWEEYRAIHPDGYAYSHYVAARVMWPPPGKGPVSLGEPQHKFERRTSDYSVFKNVISDGSGRCHGLDCKPEMSTLASAFAFISMSTSA